MMMTFMIVVVMRFVLIITTRTAIATTITMRTTPIKQLQQQ